jgi:cupin 2 domain-containing protein
MPTQPPPLLNLFAALPGPGPEEETQILLERPGLCLERIVSHGQASPEGFWYDQAEDEWVLLLRGAARLRIAGETDDRALGPGDHLLLPARLRHRVAWTDPAQPTVWLALFVGAVSD